MRGKVFGIVNLLCIDPGTDTSGFVILDNRTVLRAYKEIENTELVNELVRIRDQFYPYRMPALAYEMIASYGMPVGKSTFETCKWIGRFVQAYGATYCHAIYRKTDVCMALCGSTKAKDANIRQALLDRYEPLGGGKTPQIGTKKQPGPLFGVSSHAWSALAVGHAYLDKMEGKI